MIQKLQYFALYMYMYIYIYIYIYIHKCKLIPLEARCGPGGE